MSFVATDWSIAANGDIRYIGDDHSGAAPSYATVIEFQRALQDFADCLLYTSPSPRDRTRSRMPSSA